MSHLLQKECNTLKKIKRKRYSIYEGNVALQKIKQTVTFVTHHQCLVPKNAFQN
jgi:hypothetical protein